MKALFTSISIFCAALVLVVGCKKDKDPVPVPEDPAKRFVQILDDSLKGRGFGYSFAVYKKNEMLGSGSGGLQATTVEADKDFPVTLDSKMQIASMTKTITAASFLTLAQEKGIKTTDKIIDYLPKTWTKGPNIDLITFKELLTHTSGIIGLGEYCQNGAYSENNWYGLKALIEKGVKTENRQVSCYQNANFGLFRVLIPSILGYQFSGDDNNDGLATATQYEDYVRKNILEKAGVVTSDFLNNSFPLATFGYDFPYTKELGFNPGDFSQTVGGYGVYLSANEAVKVYSSLFSTDNNTILTTEMREQILTAGLGSYSTVTPDGKFSYHDGWWHLHYGNGKWKGFRSIWMKCPENMTVVLFSNALRNGDGLFPVSSGVYSDITSYVLWAFSQYKDPGRGKRTSPVNFHDYLEHPEPH